MKQNFTIIELLIVVSIIAIIASLLLPALNAARAKAQTISCSGNMKQIGTILMQYSMENNDRQIPVAMKTESETIWNFPGKYLYETIKVSYKVLFCPAMNEREAEFTTEEKIRNAITFKMEYGYNEMINVDVADTAVITEASYYSPKSGRIKSPTLRVQYIDTYYNDSASSFKKTSGCYRINPNIYTGKDYGRPASRHSERANILFLDGHVGQTPNFLSETFQTHYYFRITWTNAEADIRWFGYRPK